MDSVIYTLSFSTLSFSDLVSTSLLKIGANYYNSFVKSFRIGESGINLGDLLYGESFNGDFIGEPLSVEFLRMSSNFEAQ
jgi:hypothetical protein